MYIGLIGQTASVGSVDNRKAFTKKFLQHQLLIFCTLTVEAIIMMVVMLGRACIASKLTVASRGCKCNGRFVNGSVNRIPRSADWLVALAVLLDESFCSLSQYSVVLSGFRRSGFALKTLTVKSFCIMNISC